MAEEENYEFFKNKKADKTYISKRLIYESPIDGMPDSIQRIASKVIDTDETHGFAIEKDRLIIRITPGDRQEIIAKFYEDDRKIHTLTFQRYTKQNGKPHSLSFSFVNNEIVKIIEFLKNIQLLDLTDSKSVNIPDEELKTIVLNDVQLKKMLQNNLTLVSEIMKNDVTEEDIVSLGYRKKQLEIFKNMLEDDSIKESDWQKFFEANTWIFGYGLSYIFQTGLDDKKIEQVVSGFDFNNSGKRVDGLLKTAGYINSLCFVEIKTHKTLLLKNEYRAGCWNISEEFSGAVTQIQNTVYLASKNIQDSVRLKDKEGFFSGEEVFNFQPKAFLIIGKLDEFKREQEVHYDKYRSFELFRKNIFTPEIITFDELYERAKHIVHQGSK